MLIQPTRCVILMRVSMLSILSCCPTVECLGLTVAGRGAQSLQGAAKE